MSMAIFGSQHMPKPSSQTTRERNQRLREAGLHKVEVWVPNTPEKIAEAKALDKKHTIKKGGKL